MAEATQERRLEGVGCRRLCGAGGGLDLTFPPCSAGHSGMKPPWDRWCCAAKRDGWRPGKAIHWLAPWRAVWSASIRTKKRRMSSRLARLSLDHREGASRSRRAQLSHLPSTPNAALLSAGESATQEKAYAVACDARRQRYSERRFTGMSLATVSQLYTCPSISAHPDVRTSM